MSGDRTDRAIEAQGAGPLTPLQIRTLAVEARRAWHVQREMGLAEEDFDTWRHGAVQDVAPAARGLRDLTQRDFAPVRAWLRELAGGAPPPPLRDPRADDDARRARWALRRELASRARLFGGEEEARRYAEAIFRDVHRTTSEEASARQVWQVVWTMRNRATARAGARWGTGVAVRTHPERAVERAGRRGAAGNGQSVVRNVRRVFP